MSVAQLLDAGVRYLDIRIAADPLDATNIVLSHSFVSDITFDSVLTAINDFIQAHPEEILIVDILNDDQGPGQNAWDVDITDAAITARVLSIINADYILDSTYLSERIGEYGGIYFTGFVDSNGDIGTITNRRAWVET